MDLSVAIMEPGESQAAVETLTGKPFIQAMPAKTRPAMSATWLAISVQDSCAMETIWHKALICA
jgi:hypothetical protein